MKHRTCYKCGKWVTLWLMDGGRTGKPICVDCHSKKEVISNSKGGDMATYKKADVLNAPKREDVVKALVEFSQQKLSHLYKLDEKQVENVLDALTYFLSEYDYVHKSPYVHKATKKVYEHTLLTMLQFEHHACGVRIECWAM